MDLVNVPCCRGFTRLRLSRLGGGGVGVPLSDRRLTSLLKALERQSLDLRPRGLKKEPLVF